MCRGTFSHFINSYVSEALKYTCRSSDDGNQRHKQSFAANVISLKRKDEHPCGEQRDNGDGGEAGEQGMFGSCRRATPAKHGVWSRQSRMPRCQNDLHHTYNLSDCTGANIR